MTEDKFWDRESDAERERRYGWPHAFASVGGSLIFWAAVVALVYLLVVAR